MTDKKATVENYTAAMVVQLHAGYDPDATEDEREQQMQDLADKLGKSVRSIRAKLVREKLYVKKVYKTKTDTKAETKETIVSEIAQTLGVDADTSLSGLEKATKNCLILLRGTIAAAAAAVAESEKAS